MLPVDNGIYIGDTIGFNTENNMCKGETNKFGGEWNPLKLHASFFGLKF